MNKLEKFALEGSILFLIAYHSVEFLAGKLYEADIKITCKLVNYPNPNNVTSYSYKDINNDGLQDVSLTLKDGSSLEYISNGYELKK